MTVNGVWTSRVVSETRQTTKHFLALNPIDAHVRVPAIFVLGRRFDGRGNQLTTTCYCHVVGDRQVRFLVELIVVVHIDFSLPLYQ